MDSTLLNLKQSRWHREKTVLSFLMMKSRVTSFEYRIIKLMWEIIKCCSCLTALEMDPSGDGGRPSDAFALVKCSTQHSGSGTGRDIFPKDKHMTETEFVLDRFRYITAFVQFPSSTLAERLRFTKGGGNNSAPRARLLMSCGGAQEGRWDESLQADLLISATNARDFLKISTRKQIYQLPS